MVWFKVQIFIKYIFPKVDVIAQLEFEITYYGVAVQHILPLFPKSSFNLKIFYTIAFFWFDEAI